MTPASTSTALTVVPTPAPVEITELTPITPSQPPRSALPAPLQPMHSFHVLMGQWAARSGNNAFTTAALLPQGISPGIWAELSQMQAAVLRRLQQQQQNWVNGCAGLAQDYQQGKRANSMSKLLEQQCNLVAQFGQLLSQQAVDLVGLQENIEVNYGYWIAQKRDN